MLKCLKLDCVSWLEESRGRCWRGGDKGVWMREREVVKGDKERTGGIRGSGGADLSWFGGTDGSTAGVLESSGCSYFTLQFNRALVDVTGGGLTAMIPSLTVSPVAVCYCKICNEHTIIICVSPDRNQLTDDIMDYHRALSQAFICLPPHCTLLNVFCSPLGELETGDDLIYVLKYMNKCNLVSNWGNVSEDRAPWWSDKRITAMMKWEGCVQLRSNAAHWG